FHGEGRGRARHSVRATNLLRIVKDGPFLDIGGAHGVTRPTSALRWVGGIGLTLGTCLLVCGWHYGRTWMRFGTPVIGNWDTSTGYSYWQDDGYRTSAALLRFGRVLLHPAYSGLNSVGDGLYSTLWGDGLMGGSGGVVYRPPWDYELMAIGYWLALVPTLAVL